MVRPFRPFTFGDTVVTPLPADHDRHETCLLYYVERGGKRLFYGHDTGWFPEGTWEWLKDKKIDLAILDCTHGFTGNNRNAGHMNVETVLEVQAHGGSKASSTRTASCMLRTLRIIRACCITIGKELLLRRVFMSLTTGLLFTSNGRGTRTIGKTQLGARGYRGGGGTITTYTVSTNLGAAAGPALAYVALGSTNGITTAYIASAVLFLIIGLWFRTVPRLQAERG
ncbi:MBL fold metallo-hydrolase [Paenibacillus sp. LHD-117]|uniref:MBL fold metallo-hydrolase n=1 Tax=Paenibacillus sp. LHD-117 TaxID=3071412 RepID=UPI0027E13AF9|nr:MBL fold metallo-hydrolase [Paenibacillus sp. LHD-117]MDQ6421857.1 MBL fold metallo-hydrolase [Paenibacillus sp. LHD-117]